MSKFNVHIDLSETIDEFKLDAQQVNVMVEAVKESILLEIYRQWSEAASSKLNSTRNGYIRGLQLFNEGVGKGGIRLIGVLNNMIENGASAFDIKQGMSKSMNIKISKAGKWYMHIPFRFASPGSIGENEAFSGVLPQEIYDLIQDKAPNSSGNTILSKDDLPEKFQESQTRTSVIASNINKAYDAYVHKSAMYEGLIKSKVKNQTQYNTFRTVAENSDPLSWIHKGIQQYALADEAMRNTDDDLIANNTVDKVLSDFGF